jgi:glycyl-tRNA synthetase beta chain
MTQMKRPIDEFFDQVMVMVEDEVIRNNRLALLDEIGRLFLKIADFSKLT